MATKNSTVHIRLGNSNNNNYVEQCIINHTRKEYILVIFYQYKTSENNTSDLSTFSDNYINLMTSENIWSPDDKIDKVMNDPVMLDNIKENYIDITDTEKVVSLSNIPGSYAYSYIESPVNQKYVLNDDDIEYNNSIIEKLSNSITNIDAFQEFWYQNNQQISMRMAYELLSDACREGHYDIAKFVIDNRPNINIYTDRLDVLDDACLFGHLDIVKLILTRFNIVFDNDPEICIFSNACDHGNLDIAKYLYENVSDLNVRENYDMAFASCKHQKNHEMAEWLCSICPAYRIEYSDDNVAYFIDDVEIE